MIGGSRVGFRKKPHQQSAWLQLLLAVGLFQGRLSPDSSLPQAPWSNYPEGLHHSHSLRGGIGALQLTGAPLTPSLHPKGLLWGEDDEHHLLVDDDFERLSYLYRRAHSHLIAYLAEDLQDRPSGASAAGPTTIDDPQQADSLTREDADLIEILWKQDVDLGIPLEDYRPVQNTASPVQQHPVNSLTTFPASTAGQPKAFPTPITPFGPQQQLDPQNQQALSSTGQYFATSTADKPIKKGYEVEVHEPHRISIDTETGEPIFEPLPGPSSLANGTLSLTGNSTSDSFLDALMDVVDDELFCGDGEWAGLGGNSMGSSSSAVSLNGSDPSGDPFSGVLLHNASLPSAMDPSIGFASSANVSQQVNLQSGQVSNGIHQSVVSNGHATCGVPEDARSMSEQQNAQAANCFGCQTSCGGQESESFRGLPNGAVCSESTFSNGRQGRSACSTAVAMCKQNEGQGIGYAASDTGVSSMYSDECDEEWMDGASEASHEHEQLVVGDGELNYHSNSSSTSSSMSFGSGSAGTIDSCCTVPQKKYKFFGRKPFLTCNDITRSRSHDDAHVVPQPQKIHIRSELQLHGQTLQDVQHNHSYSVPSEVGLLAPVYNVQELSISEAAGNKQVPRFKPKTPNDTTAVASSSDNATMGYVDEGAGSGPVTSSRDERRARELGIPIPTEEIVRLSIDEFNERLTRYELSDDQLALIRDIRRRGKNKVAAQNCRKRKLDQISTLQFDVDRLRETRRALEVEHEQLRRLENLADMRLRQLTDLVSTAERQGNQVTNQINSGALGQTSVRPTAATGAIPKNSANLKL
ncbi:nuclear factor erythroid 2-related factor 1-like isoform X2 [Varroa destructor]|uniref:BZIP domain-containing protein n=1 Tax=Varroa destructor TaxID=109461 RepID=A0A7M7K8D9_VARDE|nr:nuclear factor erythroid 2-related factor 1-like isoform X2 [Varroa destructor]